MKVLNKITSLLLTLCIVLSISFNTSIAHATYDTLSDNSFALYTPTSEQIQADGKKIAYIIDNNDKEEIVFSIPISDESDDEERNPDASLGYINVFLSGSGGVMTGQYEKLVIFKTIILQFNLSMEPQITQRQMVVQRKPPVLVPS